MGFVLTLFKASLTSYVNTLGTLEGEAYTSRWGISGANLHCTTAAAVTGRASLP